MRKLFLVAVGTIMVSFSGIYATPTLPSTQISHIQSAEPSGQFVENILRILERDYSLDYNCLCQQYKNGDLTISKSPDGYRVIIEDDGGIILDILVDNI